LYFIRWLANLRCLPRENCSDSLPKKEGPAKMWFMSDNKVHFYYHPHTRGRIVHWMLEEIGLPYETHVLDISKGENRNPDYLKINPMGKIPAIVHKGVVVTEASAICTYLADAFPSANLAPAVDSSDRGTYYRWLFFAASCVEYATFDRMNPRIETPKRGQIGYGTYEETIEALAGALEKGFILGKQFSAADVYISSVVGWGLMTKSIDPRPVFGRYLEACQSRPAFKRFTEKAEAIAPMPKF
jgi:glutathione S-transferase